MYWLPKFYWRKKSYRKLLHYFKNYVFADPYTRDWLFISSPFPLILIILGYIYFIFYAGFRYMKNRPPYKLRIFILIYNIIQILINAWIVKEHVSVGWLPKFGFTCEARNAINLDTFKVCFYNIIIKGR